MTIKKRSRKGIPDNIDRVHIEKALEWIRQNPNERRRSLRWDLISEGKRYPPKYVVSVANRYANGNDLEYDDFVSHMAREYLSRLGYSIVNKDTGEAW